MGYWILDGDCGIKSVFNIRLDRKYVDYDDVKSFAVLHYLSVSKL